MTGPHVARLVEYFSSITPADLDRLAEFYADDASFKDPFNEVRGIPAIRRVYAHMFETLLAPRFVITRCTAQPGECWLAWEFHFAFRPLQKGRAQVVRGATHLVLGADDRIVSHRDYWDAAEELYEKLPVVGSLMRWLRRRAAS
jgi:steroid delta-isomerase